MRFTFELDNKFVAIEISDLEDEAEEFQYVTLPMGFQPPPPDAEEDLDDEAEYETPEVECSRRARGRRAHGTFPKMPKATKDLRSGGAST